MSSISVFSKASGKDSTTPTGTMTIDEFISGIKYGEWEEESTMCRIMETKKERDEYKKKSVPGVTISGLFTPIRSEVNLVEHSGFICMDVDGFTDREDLLKDPYTYALFASISNGGLAVLVKVNPEKHKESFRWLQNYYYKSYGIGVDEKPQNPASLRFVTFDPNIFVNESAKKSRTLTEKKKKVSSLPAIFPESTAEELVKKSIDIGANLADDYRDYVNLGFALASGFGETGRRMFHTLSAQSEKYESRHCDRQYDFCLRGANSGGVTVGTFYWMLKQVGVKLPKNKKYEMATTVAAMGKGSGRDASAVENQLITINSIPPEDAKRITDEVFKRDDIELKTIAHDPEKMIESMMEWLLGNHPLRRNFITDKIETLPVGDGEGQELSESHMNTIYLRARAAFNTPAVNFDLVDRMIKSDFTETYHPIKEWIERHRHLKQDGNIDKLAKAIRSPTPGYDMFIRKWLISLPAAIDGHPVRSVLSLIGPEQHTGKTEWFRRLLPKGLQKYYGESKMDAGKDDELLMCQKLILMDDEMGGKTRGDEKRFKELTSKSTFSLRAPYGHYNQDYKRLALLGGTSNELDIMNDPTGNTRILPVHVLWMNHDIYNSVDKDELFMEAVRIYESGESYGLSVDEFKHLATLTSEYETVPLERELILQFFRNCDEGGYIEYMTTSQIKDYIETHTKQRIVSVKRLGAECRSIFGDRKAVKKSGKVMQYYSVIKLPTDGTNHPTPSTGGPVTDKSVKVTDKSESSVTSQLTEDEGVDPPF